MANVQDVANFFIELGQGQAEGGYGDPVTQLQLHKLLYFAQGWHLARFGEPLFQDEIEAWKFGPVVPYIYQKYKHYGRNGIMREGVPSAANNLTADEYALLLDVAQEYMRYSAAGLVALTHEPGTPWSEAAIDDVIPKSEIERFFSECTPIRSFDDLLDGYPVEVL